MNGKQGLNSKPPLGKYSLDKTAKVEYVNKKSTDLNSESFSDVNLDHINILESLSGLTNAEESDTLYYHRLITDMQNQLRLLEYIHHENEKMEKLKREPMGQTPSKLPQSLKSLKQIVEVRQQELFELLNQQIEDLENFEKDVQNIAKKISKDSEDIEVKHLREKVDALQANIAKKMSEMRQCREDIKGNFTDKSVEERIIFINSLNEKLTRSVEQMTSEINRVRSAVSSFKLVKIAESQMLLQTVPASDCL